MDKSAKFWDRIAKNFDSGDDQYEESYIRTITKYLDRSDIVLDYACGTGMLTNEIADKVKEVHAIDISSKMLDIAKGKAARLKIENTNFVQSTIFDERFARASFDVIFAFNILHLLEDPQQVLQRINELLKPGGFFISDTVCLGENKSLIYFFLSLLSKTGLTPYINRYKISELDGLIANRNFQIVEAENLSHAPPNYFVIAKKI